MFIVNMAMVIRLMNKMFIYSAMKIRANIELLYSILNPDTSSDSPSVKSRGERCVSARMEINHEEINGRVKNMVQIY